MPHADKPVSTAHASVAELGLGDSSAYHVRQLLEIAEFFGFETRNKYQVLDGKGLPIAYAAEQQKGLLGLLLRMVLGHWRSFSIHIFDSRRRLVLVAEHPFRFFFQRLEVREAGGRPVGAIQQRFSIFSKRFDVEGPGGTLLMEVRSPIWKLWTFEFRRKDRVVASVRKRWSGGLSELFTDKDNFHVEFTGDLSQIDERALVLCAAFFIDLQYFEAKSGS